MATFEKREGKNGTRIKAIVRVKGFPAKRKTFKRLTDAKMWAQQIEVSMHKGEFINTSKESRKYCLHDLVKYYIDNILPEKTHNTQITEKSFLNWWANAIGDYSLGQVTPELIAKQINILKHEETCRDGKNKQPPRSKRTIKYYRDILDRAFKTAVKLRWIVKNPFDDVDHITNLKNERVRFLSDVEREDLLYACNKSENKNLYIIVVFALSTGARKGEIMKLTWDDIEFEREFAILRDTKNGETRSVPVASYILDLLKNKKAQSVNNSTLLFPRKDGIAPVDIRQAWETAVKRSGITDFHFHDLRHSAASYLAMNGATLSEIAAVLGHKTLAMVKRYSHISEQHATSVVTKMNDKIFANKIKK